MVAIVSRAGWGANPLATPASSIATPSPDLWLHHTGGSGHGAEYMRALQRGALAGGYVDLEYTFVVDNPTPTVFESRGPGRNTAATGGSTGGQSNNSRSHAICVMGNFENEQPSSALIDTLGDLVAQGARAGWWPAQITGPHRDAPGNATACCGRNLIARIGDINARARGSSGGTAPGPAPGGDDMPADKDFVDALATADGAWRLQYDGGVQTIRGRFFGSYFGLPANVRNDPNRRFLAITANVEGGPGYTIHSTRGEPYTFNKAQ